MFFKHYPLTIPWFLTLVPQMADFDTSTLITNWPFKSADFKLIAAEIHCRQQNNVTEIGDVGYWRSTLSEAELNWILALLTCIRVPLTFI